MAAAASALLCLASTGTADFAGEVIVFGGDAAYPPFEWSRRGEARGFGVDLSKAMAESGNARTEHWLADWPGTVLALKNGDVDVVAMFRSEERERDFAFTPPFHYVNHRIYARPELAPVTSVQELSGRSVAVEELSFAHERLLEEAAADLVLTPNTGSALEALVDGRADYAVLAAPSASFIIRESGYELRGIGPPIWPRGYAFAVRKDRPELAEWLTQRFYAVLRSNEYYEIYERWKHELEPGEQPAFASTLKIAAIPLAAFAALGLGWAFRLRGTLKARSARLIEEITRRRDAETREHWSRNHDVDTQLPRLGHFTAQVEAILAESRSRTASAKQIVALKHADHDRVIRTLGHGAGLAAVRSFVARLRAMGFEAYGQSGRDVFLVFSDSDRIAETLHAALSPTETLVMETEPLPSLYAGTASWPRDGRSVEKLLQRAETALSVATERREGWCEYRRSLDPDESDLRLIDLFRGTAGAGVYPVFQPQIDIKTGALVGAEALARWCAPEVGEVSPNRFIPLLEDAGLIRHVTGRMLHHAARMSATLRAHGTRCTISVNVSAADLLTDNTRVRILDALQAHGAVAADLKLELTETSVAQRPETVRWVITRLRECGIHTSIDDFGTGYSSLSYLSDFPIEEVKIDRSFVRGMMTRPQDRSIVRSTIAMAHELRLRVVAEGVETRAHLDMLRYDDCDRAQGFFISKPLSESDFLAFVESREGTAREEVYDRLG